MSETRHRSWILIVANRNQAVSEPKTFRVADALRAGRLHQSPRRAFPDDFSSLYKTLPGSVRKNTWRRRGERCRIHRVRFNFLRVPMKSADTLAWAPLREEPLPCPECGSISRVGRGLCLTCLLYQGLGADTSNNETLEDVLAEIDVRDRRLAAGQLSNSRRDRAWRDGSYLSRAATALAAHRRAETHFSVITPIRRKRWSVFAAKRKPQRVSIIQTFCPIYEVGENEDGLPFFSMKFASGGSSARRRTGLCAANRAAAWR